MFNYNFELTYILYDLITFNSNIKLLVTSFLYSILYETNITLYFSEELSTENQTLLSEYIIYYSNPTLPTEVSIISCSIYKSDIITRDMFTTICQLQYVSSAGSYLKDAIIESFSSDSTCVDNIIGLVRVVDVTNNTILASTDMNTNNSVINVSLPINYTTVPISLEIQINVNICILSLKITKIYITKEDI